MNFLCSFKACSSSRILHETATFKEGDICTAFLSTLEWSQKDVAGLYYSQPMLFPPSSAFYYIVHLTTDLGYVSFLAHGSTEALQWIYVAKKHCTQFLLQLISEVQLSLRQKKCVLKLHSCLNCICRAI